MTVLTIAGSPSRLSRSSALLARLEGKLTQRSIDVRGLTLRDVPAEDLIEARYNSPAARIVRAKLDVADALIVATPVYKASFSGGLKALLDLLPEHALAGKVVLPIATGGSQAHLLALEYGLKPVLSALGARHILAGVYATDSQLIVLDNGDVQISDDLEARLDDAIEQLTEQLALIEIRRAHRSAARAGGTDAGETLPASADHDLGNLLLNARCSV